MATSKLSLNYLTPNQAQKETVFNDNMDILDQTISDILTSGGGGGGGTSYDDTELRNKIVKNEEDISSLKETGISNTNSISDIISTIDEHDSQISNIQTAVTNNTNSISDIERLNSDQEIDIDELLDRVGILENSGGSGYNDSELRELIETNSDSITSLNLQYQDFSERLDNVESVNNTQDTKIEDLTLRFDNFESENFDPSSIYNDIDTLKKDVSGVKNNQLNIQNSFTELQENVDNFDSRISNNTTNISNQNERITTLEDAGGAGYDDTEIKNSISSINNEIDEIQLEQNTQNNRITTLEQSGGGSGGGGDMPTTGEVRSFIESNIPENWYKVREIPNPKSSNIDWLLANSYINNTSPFSKQYLHITSSLNTFSTNSGLYAFNKETKEMPKINNYTAYRDAGTMLCNKDGSNTLYIYNCNKNFTVDLKIYNLTTNNYTTQTVVQNQEFNVIGYHDTQYKCNIVDNAHQNIYTISRDTDNNDYLVISKYNIANNTIVVNRYDIKTITDGARPYYDLKLCYFNDDGNIVLSLNNSSDINKAVVYNVTNQEVTNTTNFVTASQTYNTISDGSSQKSDFIWLNQKDQFVIRRDSGSGSLAMCIVNNDTLISQDLFNINFSNMDGKSMFFDEDANVYVPESTKLFVNKNRFNNTSNVISNNIVQCVYNIPQ